MSTLSERAMLATLHAGSWGGSMADKEVTEEVNASYKAEKDAGRYSKQLIARKFLTHVSSKVGLAQRTHKILTLPWEDGGTRILSTSGYFGYVEAMRLQRLTIEAAAKGFVADFPTYVAEAQTRLGTMFNPDDYPDAESVRKKFYIDVEIKPVPEAADFRAKLSDASVKAIVKDIEKRSAQRLEQAMNDVFLRVADVTGKMVERLRSYEPSKEGEKSSGRFRDSLVTNIKELADLLPGLNITADPRLDQLQQQLLDDLVEHSPEVLRSDAKVRKRVSDKAERILKKVNSFLA